MALFWLIKDGHRLPDAIEADCYGCAATAGLESIGHVITALDETSDFPEGKSPDGCCGCRMKLDELPPEKKCPVTGEKLTEGQHLDC